MHLVGGSLSKVTKSFRKIAISHALRRRILREKVEDLRDSTNDPVVLHLCTNILVPSDKMKVERFGFKEFSRRPQFYSLGPHYISTKSIDISRELTSNLRQEVIACFRSMGYGRKFLRTLDFQRSPRMVHACLGSGKLLLLRQGIVDEGMRSQRSWVEFSDGVDSDRRFLEIWFFIPVPEEGKVYLAGVAPAIESIFSKLPPADDVMLNDLMKKNADFLDSFWFEVNDKGFGITVIDSAQVVRDAFVVDYEMVGYYEAKVLPMMVVSTDCCFSSW